MPWVRLALVVSAMMAACLWSGSVLQSSWSWTSFTLPLSQPTGARLPTAPWAPLAPHRPSPQPPVSAVLSLPHAACSSSFLVYSCTDNAVVVEQGDELFDSHSIGALHAVRRAQLLAVATHRTLVLERTGCDALPGNGTERDAALLCCDWSQYFAPITTCTLPASLAPTTRGDEARQATSSAFSPAAVAWYDATQECVWETEVWQRLRALFPQLSQRDIVRAITSEMLRPSASFSARLTDITALLPAAASHPLLLHIPQLSSSSSRDAWLRITHPTSWYISAVRHHSAAVPSSHLIVIASADVVQQVAVALSHLQVTDLLSLLTAYWAERRKAGEVLMQAVGVSAVMAAASVAADWLGTWSSGVMQAAVLTSAPAVGISPRVGDMNGELWSPLCRSSASGWLIADHSSPLGFNQPAMSALLSSSPSSALSPLRARTQLVLVMGAPGSGVDQLEAFLKSARALNFVANPALCAAYSGLFGARSDPLRYAKGRATLLNVLSSLPPTQRLVLPVSTVDIAVPDAVLHLYHHPAFLAALINDYALPISLQVLVIVRDPRDSLTVLAQAVKRGRRPSPAPVGALLLKNGRLFRDLLSGMEAECKAMDITVWRSFDFNALWMSDSDDERTRLVHWLLGAGAGDGSVSSVVAAFKIFIALHKAEVAAGPLTLLGGNEEQLAMQDVLALLPSLQLFNPNHAARAGFGYDYKRSASAAVAARESEADTGLALDEHITRLQGDAERCLKGKLLLFDVGARWDSNSTAAMQVLDVLRTLTLALAAGRLLVLPTVPSTVMDFLQPLSPCTMDDVGVKVEKNGDGWTVAGGVLATDALGGERVVLTHSPVVDVTYLAAWNSKDSSRYVSIQQFIGILLRLILRPSPALFVQEMEFDAAVSIPVVGEQPVDFYVEVLRRLITISSISRLRVSSSHSPFQHVASTSLLSLVDVPVAANQSMGAAMVSSIAQRITAMHAGLDVTVVQRSTTENIRDGLLELLHSCKGKLVIGSMRTEEGFILSALVPVSHWLDLFAYQFVPSLLALNHRAALTNRPLSSSVPMLAAQSSASILVSKTVMSDNCRFLFIAGLEGTGHHSITHLMSSMRVYNGSAVQYERLQPDKDLSVSSWDMHSARNPMQWRAAKRLLQERIKSLLETCRVSNSSTVRIFVINTLEEDNGFMQSWPNSAVQDRSSSHPSLVVLTRTFQELNADLRVIALTRTAGALQVSTAVHRRHGAYFVHPTFAFFYQANVLRINAAAIDADLQAIDPSFVLHLSIDRALHSDPLLTARAIAQHIGLGADSAELEQASLRYREEVRQLRDAHWVEEMDAAQAVLTVDALAIASQLPYMSPYRFDAGTVVGTQLEGRRRCRTRPLRLRLREEGAAVSVVSLYGAGGEYVRRLVEESSGIMAYQPVDRAVSTLSCAQAKLSIAPWPHSLASFLLLEAPVLNLSSACAPSFSEDSPAVILIRNPLDIALAAVFPVLRSRPQLSELRTWDFRPAIFASFQHESMPRLSTVVEMALNTTATAYVQWAQRWNVPQLLADSRNKSLTGSGQWKGAVVLRMEDLISSASSGAGLRQLLAALRLPMDDAAIDCIASVSASVAHPPRLLTAPNSTRRTRSNHFVLNSTVASLQHELISSSTVLQSLSHLPFNLLQLISPAAFAAFRRTVDSTALALDDDWVSYCTVVEAEINSSFARRNWTIPAIPVSQLSRARQSRTPSVPRPRPQQLGRHSRPPVVTTARKASG